MQNDHVIIGGRETRLLHLKVLKGGIEGLTRDDNAAAAGVTKSYVDKMLGETDSPHFIPRNLRVPSLAAAYCWYERNRHEISEALGEVGSDGGDLLDLAELSARDEVAPLWLTRFFTFVGRGPEGSEIHFTGFLDRKDGGSMLPRVTFNFNVHRGRRPEIQSETMRLWSELVEAQPVIMLHIEEQPSRTWLYKYRVLHRWMLKYPEWHNSIEASLPVELSLSEFTEVTEDYSNLKAAMEEEEARVQGRGPWASRATRLVPAGAIEIFGHIGHLSELQTPDEVLKEVSAIPGLSTDREELVFLHNLLAYPERFPVEAKGLPGIRAWLDRIQEPVLSESKMREIHQFNKYVWAVEHANELTTLSLPGFTWNELSPWRALLLHSPQNVTLFKPILENLHQRRWHSSRVSVALLLVSTVARSGDGRASGMAYDLIRSARKFLSFGPTARYETYSVVRQYLFVQAEAMGNNYAGDCIQYMKNNPGPGNDWEVLLHRQYYGPDDSRIREAIGQKIARPKPRDTNTLDISQHILARFGYSRDI